MSETKAVRGPDPVTTQPVPIDKPLPQHQEAPPIDLKSALEKVNSKNPDINGDGIPDRFEIVEEDEGWWIRAHYGVPCGEQKTSCYESKPFIVGYILKTYTSVKTEIKAFHWQTNTDTARALGSLVVVTEKQPTLEASWIESTITFIFERPEAITTPSDKNGAHLSYARGEH